MSVIAVSVLAGFVNLAEPNGALDQLPVAYLLVAESKQVPADILFSVAMAESGHQHDGKQLPWPWALNIGGRPVYCRSRDEAVQRLKKALQRDQMVDVGLMQLSWRWQKQRFRHIEEALIPMRNLEAGAAVLNEQYSASNDWWIAVGRYHDPGQDTQSLQSAKHYRERVQRIWEGYFQ